MMRTLALLLCLFLAGCGFQLRSGFVLPFDTLYLQLPETSEFRAALKRAIEASTPTRIVAEAKTAKAQLTVISDTQAKNILSLNTAGQVREYQLVRTFSYGVQDATGKPLGNPATVVIKRDLTYSDPNVLPKAAEEVLLWNDIQADLVQQLLRRLAATKTSKDG